MGKDMLKIAGGVAIFFLIRHFMPATVQQYIG